MKTMENEFKDTVEGRGKVPETSERNLLSKHCSYENNELSHKVGSKINFGSLLENVKGNKNETQLKEFNMDVQKERSDKLIYNKRGGVLSTYDFNEEDACSLKNRMFFTFKLQSIHIIKKKQGQKMYKCDICGGTYRHVFSLKRHFLRNHINFKYLSDADISNCKINISHDIDSKGMCSSEKSIKSNRHAKKESSSPKNNSIDEVQNIESEAEMSSLVVSEFMPNNSQDFVYRCHICNRFYDSRGELKGHYELHQDNRSKTRFPCKFCGSAFIQKHSFLRHLASHSENNDFSCTTCDMDFVNKQSFISHLAMHSGGKSCKYCGKILSTTANKRRHERIHEGLKPYSCIHCSSLFSQSGDLKKHIKRQHKEFFFTCSLCSNIFSSKPALKKHLSDTHSEILTTNILKQSTSKMPNINTVSKMGASTINSPTFLPKVYSCSVCKKIFKSYVNMLRHRRQTHPFLHGKRKSHRKQIRIASQKNLLKKKFMCRRSNPELTEDEFYKSISLKIADNLLNYIDGKSSQISQNQYSINENNEVSNITAHNDVAWWVTYNFPVNFNAYSVLQSDVYENSTFHVLYSENDLIKDYEPTTVIDGSIKRVQNYAASELESSIGNSINYSWKDAHTLDPYSDFSDADGVQLNDTDSLKWQSLSLEERKSLIGREVQIAYICCVCMDHFISKQVFEEHTINNHPNVVCTYIEIEGDKDIPPIVPPDLCKHFLSPVGLLCHCIVPPPIADGNDLICTKCKLKFSCVSDLHLHILACGGKEVSYNNVTRSKQQRRIKRTMKNRIDTAAKCKYQVKRVDTCLKESFIENLSCVIKPNKNQTEDLLHKNGIDALSKSHTSEKCTLKQFPDKMKSFSAKFKNNLELICPDCEESFKSNNALKSHLSQCKKKVDSNKHINHNAEINFLDIHSDSLETKKNKIPGKQSENIRETPSPSLECIVNSIKQKLTCAELSPSHSVSWMDDDEQIKHNSSDISFKDSRLIEVGDSDICPEELNNAALVKYRSSSPGSSKEAGESEGNVSNTEVNNCVKEQSTLKNTFPDEGSSNFPEELLLEPEVQNPKIKTSEITENRFQDNEGIRKDERQIIDCTVLNDSKKIILKSRDSKNVRMPLSLKGNLKKPDKTKEIFSRVKKLDSELAGKLTDRECLETGVKNECDNKEEHNKHICPYCMLAFSYLTNFRRHMTICREKKDKKKSETLTTNSTPLLFLPKKDEVESSMLNLLRHQSRQLQMMKEAEQSSSPNAVRKFQSFTCDICHKIFLSYFKMLQHQMSHKLKSDEQIITQSCDCESMDSKPLQSESNISEERAILKVPISKNISLVTESEVESHKKTSKTNLTEDFGNKEAEHSEHLKNLNADLSSGGSSVSDTKSSCMNIVTNPTAKSKKEKTALKQVAKSRCSPRTILNICSPQIASTNDSKAAPLNSSLYSPAKKLQCNNILNNNNERKEGRASTSVNLYAKTVSVSSHPTSTNFDSSSSVVHVADKKRLVFSRITTDATHTSYNCDICRKEFSSSLYRDRHCRLMHREKKTVIEDARMEANVSIKSTDTHRSVKNKNRPVFQRQCKKTISGIRTSSKWKKSQKMSSCGTKRRITRSS